MKFSDDVANSLNSSPKRFKIGATYRVTLLVNIWLKHHPAGVGALPMEIMKQISSPSASSSSSAISSTSATSNTTTAEHLAQIKLMRPPSLYKNQPTSLSTAETMVNVNVHSLVDNKDVDINAVGMSMSGFEVSTKDVEDENAGDFLVIPFLTELSDWGKGESEAGVVLRMWIPHALRQQLQMQRSNSGSSSSSSDDNSTFSVTYNDDECSAALEYEDAEGEEDLGGIMAGI